MWACALAASASAAGARTLQASSQSLAGDVAAPLVSLLTVVDGALSPHRVMQALESARAQTHPNLQLVVVDVGVKPRPDLIPAADATWVLYLHMDEYEEAPVGGSGAGDEARSRAALAAALAAARGAVVMLWDAQDLHMPTRVAAQVGPMIGTDVGTCL